MKPYSTDLRERVIRLVQQGELALQEIAELCGMSRRCVQMLRDRFQQSGEIAPRKMGRPRGTGKVPLEKVKDYVAEHPDTTLNEIRQGCHLPVCLTSISNALKRLGLSRKKKVLHASERDRPDVQAKRRKWKDKSRQDPLKRLIFIDQTGISTQMHRPYGWAPIGQRVVDAIPEKHFQTSTLMGALRWNGQFESLVYPGGTDVPAMLAFIELQLAPTLKPGDIVVWDNLSAHHSESVIKAIETTGAKVWNLPPYSPDLNPIENLWSKVKGLLRGIAARTQESLLDGLDKALQKITTNDIHHWFAHCGYAQT